MSIRNEPPLWAKISLGIGLFVALILIWLFLAGKFFVTLQDISTPASIMTFPNYWLAYSDDQAIKPWLIGSMIGATFVLVIPFAFIAFLLKGNKQSLYGDARWASTKEIEKAGLLNGKGILVGERKGKYLMLGGSQHVLLSAPTRSGKGVSVVIPNCLTWPESMVVLDIKQENWNITSGFRAKYGQKCYLFNPAAVDYRSHRWNPLGYISEDPSFRIDDIQKIGHFIFPDAQGSDPIWSGSCRTLFLGVVLYLIETPGMPVTIGEVLRQAMSGNSKRFLTIIKEREESGNPLSNACVAALSDYLDTSDNTRTSIRKTFTSRLELWLNPVIDAATADNDFDIRRLRQEKMSIYIGITPDNLDRLAPVINLFLQQIIDLNTRQMPKPNWHKVLLLMDEFTSVGKLPALQKGVAYIAGYGLRMLPIFQTPAQIRDNELYGIEGARTLIDNHALRIVFAPKSYVDAEEISKDLGYTTVKSRSYSRPETFTKGNKSHSESDQRRELLLPQEIKDIGSDAEIIFLENCKPIKCKKARYYADPVFMDRLKEISPMLKNIGKRLPSEDELVEAAESGDLAAPVKLLSINEHNENLASVEFNTTDFTEIEGEAETEITDFNIDDINNIDGFSVDDFDLDFDDIEIPAGEFDDETIDNITDEFLSKVSAS